RRYRCDDGARDRPAGGGRAHAAGEDHSRGRRAAGGGETRNGGRADEPQPAVIAVALPANVIRHCGREELDDRVPAADGLYLALPRGAEETLARLPADDRQRPGRQAEFERRKEALGRRYGVSLLRDEGGDAGGQLDRLPATVDACEQWFFIEPEIGHP